MRLRVSMVCTLFLFLSACGKSNDDKKSDPKQNSQEKVADTSRCRGPSPTGIRIDSSAWRTTTELGSRTEITTILVTPQTFKLTRQCIDKGLSLKAEVQVPSRWNTMQIDLMGSSNRKVSGDIGNGLVECEVDLNNRQPIFYTFIGPCLQLVQDQSVQVFLPSSITIGN